MKRKIKDLLRIIEDLREELAVAYERISELQTDRDLELELELRRCIDDDLEIAAESEDQLREALIRAMYLIKSQKYYRADSKYVEETMEFIKKAIDSQPRPWVDYGDREL